MKTIITYTGSEEEKINAAREDLIGYLEQERYNTLKQNLAGEWNACVGMHSFISLVGLFLGVEGLPAKVLFWDMLETVEKTYEV